MKNIAACILFLVFYSFSGKATTNIVGADTTFEDFISNFKETKLPIKMNFMTLSAEKGHKKIAKELVEKFICPNNVKDCFFDDKGNTKKYFYLFKYKISDTLLAIAYEETAGENNFLAHLVVINVHTKKMMSQLVIAGKSEDQHFEVSSDITFAFELKLKTILVKEGLNPEEKDASKHKFKVDEVSELVKIERTGKFKKLKKTTASFKGMIDAANQNKITYPVE